MDISMDVRNELDFQFLDLCDLDDSDKNELLSILKSNALKLPWDSIENNNESNYVAEIPELQNNWHHNTAAEEDYMKCSSSNAASSLIVPTMLPTHTYAPQMMTTMCNDWSRHMYINNVPTDPHVAQYMPGMAYPYVSYNIGTETHEVTPGRENTRRNGRGRGIRRDNFNRGMNSTNDIQSSYVTDQGQYHQVPTVMYLFPDHTMSPQHQVTGPIFYTQPIYSQPTIQPHPNTHPHPHQPYPGHHHQRYVRQSQPVISQPNQECTKSSTGKSYEKRAQNTHIPVKPFHPPNEEDNNSSQTNIFTTVIVKNSKLDPCVDNVDENIAANKNSTNNSNKVPPVNVTIEHNIVSTVNENCNGTEKKDVPCVNINSSIEVKQNGETDKEFKNETVSSIKTTVVKTLSKPTSKIDEKETQEKERIVTKKEQEEVVPKTVNTSVPNVAPAPSMSWASILKKGSNESPLTSLNYKPMARINPLPASTASDNVASLKTSVQAGHKDQLINNAAPERENASTNIHNNINDCKNEPLQNRCDDPAVYRMGEFLLNYQMDKQTVSLLPRGLTNRSNYCYINSILQALLACPPFYNLLLALPHPKNSYKNSSTPLIDNMVKFVNEFTPLADGARLPRKDRSQKRGEDTVVDINCGIAFEPSYVYTMLKNTSAAGVFSVEGRQEDAEEFLSCLLNGINDEMLELMKLISNDIQTPVTNPETALSSDQGEEEWKVIGPKNKGSITRCTEFGRTPLSDIFRGQLRSRVSRAGEQPTDNVQPFFTLQLDIEKVESVKDALEILVVKDSLEGMTCSKTKQQIEAWKQVMLEELPVILILHLKWFDYKLDGCSKIFKSVRFPIDLKVDSKFLSPNAAKKLNLKQKQYKLFAVTYHDGKEATKGHYITDAFHVGYQNWVRYDDSSVKCVSEHNVLNPVPPRVPYLLYYRRCDTIGNNQSSNVKSR